MKEQEEKTRVFLAVQIPDDEKKALSGIQNSLREKFSGARWSRIDGLHITLKFLGEINSTVLEEVKNMLGERINADRFRGKFGGIGLFPKEEKAGVLWIGMERGESECSEIWKSLEEPFQKLGFPREKRPFRAHITLARFREPQKVDLSGIEIPKNLHSFDVSEIILYRSILKQSGAEYSPVSIYSLR